MVQSQIIVDRKEKVQCPETWTGNKYKMWTETKWIYLGNWSMDTLSV
jgi:hypothetical protein